MFKYNFKIALQFLKQNKVFAGINLFGLSIALALSFIMLLYVINELSYDHCHSNRKNVFRVLNYYVNFGRTMPYTPYILASTLKEEFPQVEKAINVSKVTDFKIKLKEGVINVENAIATESEVFDIFTLPLIGSLSGQNILDDPNSIVLSRDLAQRLFPIEDPAGKDIVAIINGEQHVLTIKGVLKNIPKNSTFRPQCLVNSKWPIESAKKFNNETSADKNWSLDFWTTWVLLSKNCNITDLEPQFKALVTKYIRKVPDKKYSLQNLSDVYLRSGEILYSEPVGSLSKIKMFSLIALLIVTVAAINYIVLSTAISTYRAKEIGIRKTSGADNRSVRNQMLSESVLLALLVLPFACLLMWVSLPFAGKLFQKDLHLIATNIPAYLFLYITLTLFIGFASGIYTSYYLSRLRVTDILKHSVRFGNRKQLFRASLIALQLVIFCSFVSVALVIRSQYRFALDKDPGYYTKNVLFVNLGSDFKDYPSFINIVKSCPYVIEASGATEGLPIENFSGFLVKHFQHKDVKVPVQSMFVDFDFLKTMGIKLLDGRDFSKEFSTDMTKASILNETAVKQLGITEPIGKPIGSGTIIGIAKDFNIYPIHSKIPPVIINYIDHNINQIVIRYKSGTLNNLIVFLKTEWKKVANDVPLNYSTIEEQIRFAYSSEKNLYKIISISAFLALLIASVGLFGLTLFLLKTRTKEIGIKKIFGSSEKSILFSFLLENFIIVLAASTFSIPLTLYFIKKWLNGFAYRVDINWLIFAVAFIVATIVVLLTTYINSYKAVRTNPVVTLKVE